MDGQQKIEIPIEMREKLTLALDNYVESRHEALVSNHLTLKLSLDILEQVVHDGDVVVAFVEFRSDQDAYHLVQDYKPWMH